MSAQTTLITASPEEIAAMVGKEVARLGLTADPVWLKAEELGARLGLSKQHIENLAFYNKIPYIDCALPGSTKRVLRFSLAAVERKMWGD